jgi:hypothetical protein
MFKTMNILLDSLSIITLVKKKRNSSIDDETLENMRRYYKIDDHKELLQYIKKNGIIKGDFEHE